MEVNTTTTMDPLNMYNYMNNWLINPTVFITIFLIIIAYFVLFYSLGNTSQDSTIFSGSNNNTINGYKGQQILGMVVIAILIILILFNALQYFFSINISAYIKNFFTSTPEIDIVVDQNLYQPQPVPEIKFRKQVFNIPGNYYNYENAKALCKAYGSELATYQQIEEAYNSGAEWCNYGWSAEQMALFPTQQKTYDNLQNIKGHGHDCGRPGINGGYIANPEVKFGVNCYGNKPKIDEEEEELMKITNPIQETVEDIAFQKRVNFWKTQVDNILVSPFNYNMWTQI